MQNDLVSKAQSEERVGRMVKDLLKYHTTMEAQCKFLKARVIIFLKGERGRFFSVYDIERMFGLTSTNDSILLNTSLKMVISDYKQGVRMTSDFRYVYPREGQRIW